MMGTATAWGCAPARTTASTLTESAATNTGIHVGSTVGEALDLYPGITLGQHCLTLSEPILGPEGCRLELYFSPGSGPEEPPEATRARTITRICISVPTWPVA